MTAEQGRVLLRLARGAVQEVWGEASEEAELPGWLSEPGASFVTLTKHGELRGCIGTLVAHRSLKDDVQSNARAAAFQDPRFAPVEAAELPQLRFEVSVLSALRPVEVSDERTTRALVPTGVGVVLEAGFHRATFLPQVWEQLPDPETFWLHLKLKAGLSAQYWDSSVQVSTYTVEKWKEP